MSDNAIGDAAKARLDAYLKEYDMLVAENRVWLAANDPKLTAGFAACIALATAGFWRDKYPLFLLIPLVVVFLSLILLFQLENVIHLAAQLTVLEEKINELIGGEPAMTFFGQIVATTMDKISYRDPVSRRAQISPNFIFACVAGAIFVGGSWLGYHYGFPALQASNPTLAWWYRIWLIVAVVVFALLFVRSFFLKKACINIVRAGYASRNTAAVKVSSPAEQSKS